MLTPEASERVGVRELREAFDQGFTRVSAPSLAGVDVLAVRVAGAPFAIRLDELVGIATGRRIVPLPGARAPLLGLIGLRGALVPVLSLAALVVGPPGAREPRWVALVNRASPIGFAFDGVDAYVRCAPEDLVPGSPDDIITSGGMRHLDQLRPMLRLSAAAEAVLQRAPRTPEP